MGLLDRLFRRKPEYVYGTAGAHQRAARKHKSGRVEFVMWKAGEQGHTQDYWTAFDEYWWPTFRAVGQYAELRAQELHEAFNDPKKPEHSGCASKGGQHGANN